MAQQAEKFLCLDKECIYSAARMLENMNEIVNPCDNFYEFACGGFIKSQTVPDDRAEISPFEDIKDILNQRMQKMFEEPNKSTDIDAFRFTKNLYKTCMNTTAVEEQGLNPLKSVLEKIGGWPVLDSELPDNKVSNWTSYIYNLRGIGFMTNFVFSLGIGLNPTNISGKILIIDKPSFDVPYQYFRHGFSDTGVQAYFKFIVDMAIALGAEQSNAKEQLAKTIEFQIKLAEIIHDSFNMPTPHNVTNETVYTVGQLEKNYPTIPWIEYINNFLLQDFHINSSEPMIVRNPEFFEKLEKLINATPKKVLANYIISRIIAPSTRYLSKPAQMMKIKLESKKLGITKLPSRDLECVSLVSQIFDISVGAMYAREYSDKKVKALTSEIANNIKNQFRRTLQKINWMDRKTKKYAREKLDHMTEHIAYPEEFLNNSKFEEYYGGLLYNGSSLYEKLLSLNRFRVHKHFSELRLPFRKNHWTHRIFTVFANAFYNALENSMIVPAGILQGIFFKQNRPLYLNYGGIGSVIAHELTHGFDNKGLNFDKNGELFDWWDKATKQHFIDRAICFIQQYGNYSLKNVNMTVDGLRTLGENIADNGGIKNAYNAHLKLVDEYKENRKRLLPGLQKYNRKQLFWLSYANVWCSKARPELTKMLMLSDVHSPDEFRVNGPISNMPEFSEDFNCKAGTKMNPVKKCSIW